MMVDETARATPIAATSLAWLRKNRVADDTGFEVVVLSGIHAGARQRFELRSHTVIGTDMACDLILRDAGIAPRHLMLVLLDGKLSAVRLDGSVQIDGVALAPGKSVALTGGVRIDLGGVLMGVGEPDADWKQPASPAPLPWLRRGVRRTRGWLAQSARRRAAARSTVLGLALLCVILSLCLPLYQWSSRRPPRNADLRADAARLTALITPLRLPEVKVAVQTHGKRIVVSGYVQSDAELLRLERVIRTAGLRPAMQVFSGERLRRDTLAYAARYLQHPEVQSSRADTVTVLSPTPLIPDSRAQLTSAMLRDIPGLRSVTLDLPPVNTSWEIAPNPYSILATGNLRFLIGEDGSRYFTGAQLAGDVVLRAVGGNSITVERKLAE
ncbi:EscD/YscD/HrpQ family type III secretion system periplasmic domain-containing protein [Burkholderia pyrrocinia]|uniref:EscD/YscD/HrpQ family type III secretion system periplasmic domain-containing protein n=1 Tax=Burkholderia pyrrocinia TaxID=60550 RepID=UPI00104B3F22|nr:phosphopeptide-binding protein [Burkholderia pyrrocinia]TDA48286.1 phosphopeptide-binding protein [Burkholderia pyrrocinia]